MAVSLHGSFSSLVLVRKWSILMLFERELRMPTNRSLMVARRFLFKMTGKINIAENSIKDAPSPPPLVCEPPGYFPYIEKFLKLEATFIGVGYPPYSFLLSLGKLDTIPNSAPFDSAVGTTSLPLF